MAAAINPDDIDFQLLPGLDQAEVNNEFNLDGGDGGDGVDENKRGSIRGHDQISDNLAEIEEDDMPNLNVPRKSTKINLRGQVN